MRTTNLCAFFASKGGGSGENRHVISQKAILWNVDAITQKITLCNIGTISQEIVLWNMPD